MEAARAFEPQSFGSLLRQHRVGANLSQEALAERARISVNGVSALERGIRRTPQSETLALLVGALELEGDARRTFENAARGITAPAAPEPDIVLAADTRPGHLPLALTPFFGREGDIAELSAAIAANRLVTLVGTGGIGKTRTSLRVAAQASRRDGVWFVEFAPVSSGAYLPATIGIALGLEVGEGDVALAALVRLLADKELLLVLDNCEHVVEAAARTISEILRACAGVSILASSRHVLGVAGERVYRLQALDVPDVEPGAAIAPDDAMRYAAIALFVDRAQAVDHTFALTSENAPVVAGICKRLDGIALAIELAAARARILDSRRLLAKIDERFHLLTGGNRDLLPHQRTLRATIEWSYELLDLRERALFRNLSIFAGTFSIDDVVAIGGDRFDEFEVLDLLASLVDKSLVLADIRHGEMRYRLFESMRAYGLERLDAAGERDAVARRHLDYLSATFAALDWRSESSGDHEEIESALSRVLEDVRAALDFGLAHASDSGAHLLLAIPPQPWRTFGLSSEVLVRAQAYVEAIDAREARSRALLWSLIGAFHMEFGRISQAVEAATRGVEAARSCDGDGADLPLVSIRYAMALIWARRFDEAEAALHAASEGADVPPRTRKTREMATALLHFWRGDFVRAVAIFEARLEDTRANERQRFETVGYLAETYHGLGETQRAVEVLASILPGLRATNNRANLSLVLGNLAAYNAALGRLADSFEAAAESIGILLPIAPGSFSIALSLETLALIHALDGAFERAAFIEGYADNALRLAGFARPSTEQTTYDRLRSALAAGMPAGVRDAQLARGAEAETEYVARYALETRRS